GIWEDSGTLWNHVLRHDPGNWVAYVNRGWARNDPATAMADYTAALQANPHFYPAWYDRGEARLALGDHAGLAPVFTEALRPNPGDPRAWNNRGWARESLGDRSGAAADYTQALAVAPPGWTHRTLVEGNLARVHGQPNPAP